MYTLDEILHDLASNRVKDMILDTDAYNEVDDQFAIAYAMRSPEKVHVLSFNAAPFFNFRSTSPEDGMLKSYDEILNIQHLVDPNSKIPVYYGSRTYLPDANTPVESEAARNIVKTVKEHDGIVYIVAIGAITNVASAILMDPSIIENACVIWLGGNAWHAMKTGHEFNMMQDFPAASVIFNSKVPVLQIPCAGVCTEFLTTIPELEYYLARKNALCDYLVNIVKSYPGPNNYGWSKVIWDVTAVASLVFPQSENFIIKKSPIITPKGYVLDETRHPYIYVEHISRDPLFADLFRKLAK